MFILVKLLFPTIFIICGMISYIDCDETVDVENDCFNVTVAQDKDEQCNKTCQFFYIRNDLTNKTEVGCCKFGLWFNVTSKKCCKVGTFSTQHQQQCFKKKNASGTTPNIRDVIIGRCWEYQLLFQQNLFPNGNYKNCTHLYDLFHKAFVNKNPCGEVEFGEYDDFLKCAHVEDLSDNPYSEKLLFWSGINQFSQDYANGGKRLFTLENTLPGYMIDKLIWCGQKKKKHNQTIDYLDPGINFNVCPPWNICEKQAQVVFWEEASEYFAKVARSKIHLMLNGSDKNRPPFCNTSFFANHELKKLNSKYVKKVNILVSHLPGFEIQETCNNGPTLSDLKDELARKGISSTCEDNPADVLHLHCTDAKNNEICRKRIIPKKKHSFFKYTHFGYSVESEGEK